MIAEHEEASEPTEEPLDPTYQGKKYRILKCAGCDTVYFQQERLQIVADDSDGDEPFTGFDELKDYAAWSLEHDPNRYVYEETSYWPAHLPKRRRPEWHKLSDSTLIKHLNSVYTALENDLRVLAAIGMRTVFDRVSELVGIDTEKPFAEKLKQLHYEGHIGAADSSTSLML